MDRRRLYFDRIETTTELVCREPRKEGLPSRATYREIASFASTVRCPASAIWLFAYLPTIASENDKEKLLRVIDLASRFVRLPRLLACIGLSSSRYYDWKNAQECGLDDFSSCPRSSPGQMTATERSEMRSMVQSEDYRHLSVGSIARLAARLGKVYACSSTWYRAIQNGNWIRSRKRIYPPKARVGLRATKPNEYWHVDTTIIRLLNGVRQ